MKTNIEDLAKVQDELLCPQCNHTNPISQKEKKAFEDVLICDDICDQLRKAARVKMITFIKSKPSMFEGEASNYQLCQQCHPSKLNP